MAILYTIKSAGQILNVGTDPYSFPGGMNPSIIDGAVLRIFQLHHLRRWGRCQAYREPSMCQVSCVFSKEFSCLTRFK